MQFRIPVLFAKLQRGLEELGEEGTPLSLGFSADASSDLV